LDVARVTGEWTKLHRENIYNLYCSPVISKVIKNKEDERGESCSTHWTIKNAYGVLVEKLKGRVSRPRSRWEDNINTELQV
jgi:hypothetical protein